MFVVAWGVDEESVRTPCESVAQGPTVNVCVLDTYSQRHPIRGGDRDKNDRLMIILLAMLLFQGRAEARDWWEGIRSECGMLCPDWPCLPCLWGGDCEAKRPDGTCDVCNQPVTERVATWQCLSGRGCGPVHLECGVPQILNAPTADVTGSRCSYRYRCVY